MPKQTQYYKIGYFAEGEFLDAATESNRFETIDSQIYGLFSVIGNGVLEGWLLTESPDGPLDVVIGPGRGVISYVYASSARSETLTNLVPESVNYIYATMTDKTYWDQSVTFQAFLSGGYRISSVFLGTVTTGETEILSIDIANRENIGLVNSIQEAIALHRHTGGEGQPDPVNLNSEVQGVIKQQNLPELDASIITTGVLEESRIPTLDHDKDLTNKGTLTHSQLDSFVEQLSHQHADLMGETALVNLLQLILALKSEYPGIDDYLLNELAYIPGISPDAMVDFENTTANVDTVNHVIEGVPVADSYLLTKTWNSNEEFSDEDNVELNNVIVDGDKIRLNTTETKTYIDDFENISDWNTSVVDLVTGERFLVLDGSTRIKGLYSGKLNLNMDSSSLINVAFLMEKTFNAQDWSVYNRIVFYIKTAYTDHGNLYFYLNDEKKGIQDSYRLVLEAGAPTINRDSLMQGWREVSVDISEFDRDSVISAGFYMSSDTGWEPSAPFELNVDEMFLTTGNMFVDYGTARFIYTNNTSNPTPTKFHHIRWDALNDAGITARYRLADTKEEFSSEINPPTWYQYILGTDISNPVSLKPWIQIEIKMSSQQSGVASPELNRLHLDYYSYSSEANFTFDTQDEWTSGTLVNLDTWTNDGWISISNTSEVGNITYSQDKKVFKANSQVQNIIEIAGSSLPKSTKQTLYKLPATFGQLSGVTTGEHNSLWLADTDNDRVVQIDSSGNLLKGFYGSFLKAPNDPYGIEEQGPGSNKEETLVDEEEEESSSSGLSRVEPLHAIYNPLTGLLSVVFNQKIEYVFGQNTRIDPNTMYIGAKSHRVFFDQNTNISLWGLDETKTLQWSTQASNPFINQFSFSSHILTLQLTQADMATLASIVDFERPSLTISSPKCNEELNNSSVSFSFDVSNFELGDLNRIRYRIDYETEYHYSLAETFSVSGLSDGLHQIEASLVDMSGDPLPYNEATLQSSFIVDTQNQITSPVISIISPTANQIISTPSVTISFVASYPILNNGSHIRYTIDNEVSSEHRSEDEIQTVPLTPGEHTLTMWLADENGDIYEGEYSTAITKFFIGVNSDVNMRLYLDKDAVRNQEADEDTGCKESHIDIDVGNIYISNIYAPIDIQFIPSETSKINPSGGPSILVSKMRAPSSTYYLGNTIDSTNPKSIFGSPYLDGHSVVQLDMAGNLLFSNNAARFASSLEEVKSTLGSAEKVSENELLIADADRNRAIITSTNLDTGKTFISWQYSSDRAVSDFHFLSTTETIITVGNGTISPETISVREGTSVIWKNESNVSIQILSGKITPEQFLTDPDLTLYGDEFSSGNINVGQEYSFKFENLGSYYWFSYDGQSIQTGLVHVSRGRISTTDEYLVVENDASSSLFGSRVIKINAWGDVVWSFGEDWLHKPKDARGAPDGSILIST